MDAPFSGRSLHFVGIGGAGMSGLALVAKGLGATVTGSDRATSGPYVERLRAAGIEPSVATPPSTCPRAPRSSSRAPSRRTTPSARSAASAGQASCTARTCSAS